MFRKFAFIGYKCLEEAEAAVKRFNKSFINTARLQVHIQSPGDDVFKYNKKQTIIEDHVVYINLCIKKNTVYYSNNVNFIQVFQQHLYIMYHLPLGPNP